MNDPTSYNFSFSYTESPETAPAPAAADLIMFDDCQEYQLPGDHVLVRSKRTGVQSVVTNDVLYALRFCSSFRTLDDHLASRSLVSELLGKEQRLALLLEVLVDPRDGRLDPERPVMVLEP